MVTWARVMRPLSLLRTLRCLFRAPYLSLVGRYVLADAVKMLGLPAPPYMPSTTRCTPREPFLAKIAMWLWEIYALRRFTLMRQPKQQLLRPSHMPIHMVATKVRTPHVGLLLPKLIVMLR